MRRISSRVAAAVGLVAVGAAVGYAVSKYTSLTLVVAGGLALVVAVTERARTLVLGAAVASLVLGSAVLPGFQTGIFYVRFLMLGALVVLNLLETPAQGVGLLRGLDKPLLAVFLLAMASAFWSVDPVLSAERAVGLGLMIAAVLTTGLRAWSTRESLTRDIATAGSVVGIAMIVGVAALVFGAEWAQLGWRFRGIMENPNTVGLMGALVLPTAAGLAIVRRGPARAWWFAVTVATTASLLLSQSRGGLISGGAGLLVMLVLWKGGRRALAGAAVFVVTATLLVVVTPSGISTPRPLESVALRFERAPTLGGRNAAWTLAVGLIREKPVAGWGFGTTEEVFGVRATAISPEFEGSLVHNSYLQTLLELGPVALLFLLLAVGGALRRGWPGARADPLSAALYGALIAGVMSAIVESSMLSAGSIFAFNFWLIAAASVRLGTLAEADSRQAVPSLSQG